LKLGHALQDLRALEHRERVSQLLFLRLGKGMTLLCFETLAEHGEFYEKVFEFGLVLKWSRSGFVSKTSRRVLGSGWWLLFGRLLCG
tara:strand:- start:129 stop:389 length:261 start_codon:yes stop_codon:yes gene_type:complete